MLPIQWILLVGFILFAARVIAQYRSGDINFRSMLVWLAFWFVAGLVVVRPNLSADVAKLFGVGRGADVVVYISLAALFFMIFRINVRMEKINRDISKIVREDALKK